MFFCNVSEKYNNDIELLCNNNSICIVFEYNSGNRFLKDINIVANRAKNSINEFSDRLLKEYGFKNDKIGNIYCFYQDEFIMPPFCSCGELINYLDVLGKILININYGRYNLINGKLVSIDQEEIEKLVGEIVHLDISEDVFRGDKLPIRVKEILNKILVNKYFIELKSIHKSYLKLITSLKNDEYLIGLENGKFIISSPDDKIKSAIVIKKNTINLFDVPKYSLPSFKHVKRKDGDFVSNNTILFERLYGDYRNEKKLFYTDKGNKCDSQYFIFASENASRESLLRVCSSISSFEVSKKIDGILDVRFRSTINSNSTISDMQKNIVNFLPKSYKRYILSRIRNNNVPFVEKEMSIKDLYKRNEIEKEIKKMYEGSFDDFKIKFSEKFPDGSLIKLGKLGLNEINNMIMLDFMNVLLKFVFSVPDYIGDVDKSYIKIEKTNNRFVMKVKDISTNNLTLLTGMLR